MKSQKNTTKRLVSAALMGASALMLAGCGKTAFVVSQSTQKQMAPGSFTVPAKVDILLAEDDSGSIMSVYGAIAQQMPQFLAGLEAKGWDYHFATTPLTYDRALSQAVASRHDANWGSLWTPPYPGAPFPGSGTLASSVFRTPDTYAGFLSYSDMSNSNNSTEAGFETIRKTLTTRESGTNFLRPDAMLVVLVVGNGEDTSGVTYCQYSGGVTATPESGFYGPQYCWKDGQSVPTTSTGTKASSFASYKSAFQGLKSTPSLFKMYAAVSPSNTSNCLGGSAWAGSRYSQMAAETGGQSYDICAQSVSNVLGAMSQHLQNQRLALRTRYVFLNKEPDVSTIKVVKYLGGTTPVELPQSATDGWTYAGYVSPNAPVYTIDSPVPMNLASGYAIELHGSAKLLGDDTADVTYLEKGLGNSAQ